MYRESNLTPDPRPVLQMADSSRSQPRITQTTRSRCQDLHTSYDPSTSKVSSPRPKELPFSPTVHPVHVSPNPVSTRNPTTQSADAGAVVPSSRPNLPQERPIPSTDTLAPQSRAPNRVEKQSTNHGEPNLTHQGPMQPQPKPRKAISTSQPRTSTRRRSLAKSKLAHGQNGWISDETDIVVIPTGAPKKQNAKRKISRVVEFKVELFGLCSCILPKNVNFLFRFQQSALSKTATKRENHM